MPRLRIRVKRLEQHDEMVSAALGLHLKKKEVAELTKEKLAIQQTEKEEGIIHGKGGGAKKNPTGKEDTLYLLRKRKEQEEDLIYSSSQEEGEDRVEQHAEDYSLTNVKGQERGVLQESCSVGRREEEEGIDHQAAMKMSRSLIGAEEQEGIGLRERLRKDDEHGIRRGSSFLKETSPLTPPAEDRLARETKARQFPREDQQLMAAAGKESRVQIKTRGSISTTQPAALKSTCADRGVSKIVQLT